MWQFDFLNKFIYLFIDWMNNHTIDWNVIVNVPTDIYMLLLIDWLIDWLIILYFQEDGGVLNIYSQVKSGFVAKEIIYSFI